MSQARVVLEQDYPLLRDRCQAAFAILEEGLAYHAIRIPNDPDALDDHRQVQRSLEFAKGLIASLHDALPESATDRELTDDDVSRLQDALNIFHAKLERAAEYIDRPDHSPTSGGVMKLGVATALGGLAALIPGVGAGAVPVVYACLYGKDGAEAMIKAFKGS